MTNRPFAESAERNGAPILEVLLQEFSDRSMVLEIGSGTGQHAARFATGMEHLQWQTSDRDENHAGILAWVESSKLPNLLPPLSLDVRTAVLAEQSYDAVFSANTAHIMSFASVEKMFALAGSVLQSGGIFCLYGPFRCNGKFNTQSNAEFDASLRSRDSEMGIRDLEELDALGEECRMSRTALYSMPANNHLAVWRKDVQ